jgi:hypothetical protein
VKEDYLLHFSLPQLDLLAWVLITKLALTYYQKLDMILTDIGRFRELPSWRKEFKRVWKNAMKTPITMPLNKRYQPDVKRFVCTCPHFVVSRFVTDLQGPPSERTQTEKLRDLKKLAQHYARDRGSCDDVRISYLEFLETEADDDLMLARMIAG